MNIVKIKDITSLESDDKRYDFRNKYCYCIQMKYLVPMNPGGLYDIPEGEHDVLFNGTHCKLFTWKNINIASKGSIVWKSETNKTYEFDMELSQKGLIVSLTDINGLRDALDKLIHKPIII